MSTKEAKDSGVSRRRASAPKAGSVWETRMKLDEVRGGIKVFNATQQNPDQNTQIACATSESPGAENKGETVELDKRIRDKQSPVGAGNSSTKRKTWKSESFEGSPIQIGKQRSELCKNLDEKFKETSDSADGIFKRSPIQIKNARSVPVQSRKAKPDSAEDVAMDESSTDSKSSVSLQLAKVKTKNPEEKKSRSEEEFGACEEKRVTSNADSLDQIKNAGEQENNKEIEVGIAEKDLEIKEMSLQENKPKKLVVEEKKSLQGNEKSVQISPSAKRQIPAALNNAKFHQNPIKIGPIPDSVNLRGVPRPQSKLQSFADLIMWRNVSRSSFVFGIGFFAIISSSFTKDLNISFISVVSYLGLLYLAANFLFRSLVTRGNIDNNGIEEYMIGEEDAIWLIKMVIPCVNEFLLELRALFSGDPATTMKLAVLLFILARCGSSLTMWKLAKLGFIGIFTVPKLCSSYSSHLTAHGTFWIRRFRDAWESCSHKKAVGFAIFSLVWNLSSVVARIWSVFMLFVVFKYYQHSLIREGCVQEEGRSQVSSNQVEQSIRLRRHAHDPILLETRKTKKAC